jgi:integrase
MKTTKNLNPKETRIITREEEAKLVVLLRDTEHCKVRSYYADVANLVEVLADTGMRLGEALSLLNTDIDFKNNIILIRVTKGNHRRVPMTKRVVAILKMRQEAGHDKPFNLKEHQIHRAWSWVRVRIGIDDAHQLVLHSLRRTSASRLVNAGVALDIVEEWLCCNRNIGGRRRKPLTPHQLVKAAEMLENSARTHL